MKGLCVFLAMFAFVFLIPTLSYADDTGSGDNSLNKYLTQDKETYSISNAFSTVLDFFSSLQNSVSLTGRITAFGGGGASLNVSTGIATNVTWNSTTINGSIDIENNNATAYLQYKENGTQTWTNTSEQHFEVDGKYELEENLTGLNADTTYNFRIVGEPDEGETEYGENETFTTDPEPYLNVTTGEAYNIDYENATINGSVDIINNPTDTYLQYRVEGTDTWSNTSIEHFDTDGLHELENNLTGLNADTTYNFRIVGEPDEGDTEYGEIKNFTTETTNPPIFTTIPDNETINYGDVWEGVDFEAEDGIDAWWINDTENFNINQTGYLNDNHLLSAATYKVNVSVNNTHGDINSTIYELEVEKTNPELNLTITNSTYPENFTVDASAENVGDDDLVYNLYVNGELVADGNNTFYEDLLSAGVYDVEYNTTGGQNYSSNSVTDTVKVEQGSPDLDITGTSHITYGTETDVEGLDCPEELTCQLNQSNDYYGVGDHTFKYYTDGNENYTSDEAVMTATVEPKNLDVMVDNKSKVYGETDPDNTVTYDGFVLGEDEEVLNGELQFSRVDGESVGTYEIETSGLTAENYSLTYYNGTLTITEDVPDLNLTITNSTYPENFTVDASAENVGDDDLVYNLYVNGELVADGNNTFYEDLLSAGVYDVEYNTTGGQNYSSNSVTDTVKVEQGSPDLDITGTSHITYGTETDVEGLDCPEELTCMLYRSATEVENPDKSVLSTDTYEYVYNTTGNNNYTYESVDFELEVQKANDSCDLLFNETSPLTYPATFKVYSNCTTDFELYRNGTQVENNSEQKLPAGKYNFEVNRTDTQNYSNVYDSENFTINKASSQVHAYINNSRANYSADELTAGDTSLNGTLISGEGEINMYLNDTLINEGSSPLVSTTNLSVGEYWFNVTYEETENYSASMESWSINVDTKELNLTINSTQGGSTNLSEGTHTYEWGDVVRIQANADSGWYFDGWTGDYESANEEISFEINNDMSIIANFLEEDDDDDTTSTGGGGGTSSSPTADDETEEKEEEEEEEEVDDGTEEEDEDKKDEDEPQKEYVEYVIDEEPGSYYFKGKNLNEKINFIGNSTVARIQSDLKDNLTDFTLKVRQTNTTNVNFTGDAYQFINLSYNKTHKESIGSTNITFRVERDWIENNNLSHKDISIFRYNGGWNKLDSSVVIEDNNFIYYEAFIEGLSLFTIGKKQELDVPIDKPEKIDEKPTKKTGLTGNFIKIPLLIFLIIAVVISFVVIDHRIVKEKQMKTQENKLKKDEANNIDGKNLRAHNLIFSLHRRKEHEIKKKKQGHKRRRPNSRRHHKK
ncbi:MAG: MBG domain-containing protein [Candidatus Nanoarchaeia archaeon]